MNLQSIGFFQMLLNFMPWMLASLLGLAMLGVVLWVLDRWVFHQAALRELVKMHPLGVPLVVSSLVVGLCYIIGQGVGG